MSTTTASGPSGQQLIELRGLPVVAVPVAGHHDQRPARRLAASAASTPSLSCNAVPVVVGSDRCQRVPAGPRGPRRRRCQGSGRSSTTCTPTPATHRRALHRRAAEPPPHPTPQSRTGRARTSHARGGWPAPLPRQPDVVDDDRRRPRPRRQACTWSSTSSSCSAPRQSRSAPAARPATAASPMERRAAHALHVQGVGDDRSGEAQLAAQQIDQHPAAERGRRDRRGRAATTWDVITASTPASMTARNGTSSRARTTSIGWRTTGRSRCESTVVSPWPGKCLAHAATPAACKPPDEGRAVARRRAAGSAPNERTPMTGLAGLLLTSTHGARSSVIPAAASIRADGAATAVGERDVVDGAERGVARVRSCRSPSPAG